MILINKNHYIVLNFSFQLLLVEREKVEVEEAAVDDMELQVALLEVAHMDLVIVRINVWPFILQFSENIILSIFYFPVLLYTLRSAIMVVLQ